MSTRRAQTSLEYLLLMVLVATLVIVLFIFLPSFSVKVGTSNEGFMNLSYLSKCGYNCTTDPGCLASQPANSTPTGDNCCSSTRDCYACLPTHSWNGTGCCQVTCPDIASGVSGCMSTQPTGSQETSGKCCGSGSCYECPSGTTWNSSTLKCESAGPCVPDCSTASSGPGCRGNLANAHDTGDDCCGLTCFTCDDGYAWNSFTETCDFTGCTKDCATEPGCRGSQPANSTPTGDECCGEGTCFICDDGFSWNSVNETCDLTGCTKDCATEPGCRGSQPANSTPTGDECCGEGTCFECDPGFVWDSDADACIPSGCTITCPDDNGNPMCKSEQPSGAYATGDECCGTGTCYACPPGYHWDMPAISPYFGPGYCYEDNNGTPCFPNCLADSMSTQPGCISQSDWPITHASSKNAHVVTTEDCCWYSSLCWECDDDYYYDSSQDKCVPANCPSGQVWGKVQGRCGYPVEFAGKPTFSASPEDLSCPGGTVTISWSGPDGKDPSWHYEGRIYLIADWLNPPAFVDLGNSPSSVSVTLSDRAKYLYDGRVCDGSGHCGPVATDYIIVSCNPGCNWHTTSWSGTCLEYCSSMSASYMDLGFRYSASGYPSCTDTYEGGTTSDPAGGAFEECETLFINPNYYIATACGCQC